MKNFLRNTALFIFFLSFYLEVKAQDSAQTTPAAIITTPNNTSTTQKPKQRSKRRISRADSLRLVAQRDSIARLQLPTINQPSVSTPVQTGSAFNIGASNTLPATPNATDTVAAKPQVTISQNPFDILRGEDKVLDKPTEITTSTPTRDEVIPPSPSSLLNKQVLSKNFLFWVFMVILVFMAFVVANLRSTIGQAYQSLYSNNALRQIYKEPVTGWGGIANIALYTIFFLNGGVFLYLIVNHFGFRSPFSPFLTLLLCVGTITCLYMAKHFVLFVLASVFPISKEMRTYNYIILTAGILLGLALMPLNLFIAFAPTDIKPVAIYIAFGLIFLLYLVRSLRGLTVAAPYVLSHRFHFLLYLCTVEFAPVLVLAKLILGNS